MRPLIHSLLAAVLGLGILPMAHAQSGGIDASPSTVVIPSGSSVGTTDVFWTVSGGEAFYITVNCGGGDGLFASSGAGNYSQSAPWITIGASCVFSLRAYTPTGPVLGSVTVNGVTPNGAISAAPETVVIPAGQSHGTTNIAWAGEHASSFHVTVNCGGADGLFASSGPGTNSQSAPWIGVGSSCAFRLRADSPSGPVMDSVTVTGVAGQAPSGSISAAPTTVNIPAGQSSGSTTLSWVGQNAGSFFVTRDCGGGESVFTSSGAGSYNQVASGITAGASCAFRLRADSASGTVLGSVTVNGVATQTATGTLTATPSTVSIPPGQSTGTTTLNWTAQGGTSFHVTASCDGNAEQLFASSGAGSYNQSAPWITVGAARSVCARAPSPVPFSPTPTSPASPDRRPPAASPPRRPR
jgi:hypothetical protein